MSIADNTKHEGDSFACSDAPFIDCARYSNCFQSLLGTLQGSVSSNSNAIHGETSHNAVSGDNNFCFVEGRNTASSSDLPELLASPIPSQLTGGSDLFDALQLQQKPRGLNGSEVNNPESMSCGLEQAVKSLIGDTNDDFTGLIAEADPDQLLDAIVSKMSTGRKQNLDASVSCSTSVASADNISFHSSCHPYTTGSSSGQLFYNMPGVSSISVKTEIPAASFGQSSSSIDMFEGCSQRQQGYKSQIRLWVENSQSVASDSLSAGLPSDGLSVGQCKRFDEIGKSSRKRPRPGDNPRPKPKDRQMIQDRIKELREIVPNSAKVTAFTSERSTLSP